MESKTKEVRFDLYCKTCKNYKANEWEDPCNECLKEPSNENSHRPVYWQGEDS